jgi:thiol-disulfide isomerase/thioredoxin
VRVVALVALLTLVVTSACSRGRDESGPPVTSDSGTGAPCVPAATSAASSTPGTNVETASNQKVPDLSLACFAGGDKVEIGELHRPAILNLWASWCTPCRTELPALNTYAQRGTVLVLGVNTEDSRTGAGSIVDDLKLGFPNLYDREGKLHKALGSLPMPVTLFLTADGTVVYTHRAGALDTAGFERIAREYLGVAA